MVSDGEISVGGRWAIASAGTSPVRAPSGDGGPSVDAAIVVATVEGAASAFAADANASAISLALANRSVGATAYARATRRHAIDWNGY